MQITVSHQRVRRTPRKIEALLDLIRDKKVARAHAILAVTPQTSSNEIAKLLQAALAAARDKNANEDNLVISEAYANAGMKLKRFHPRSRGRTTPYRLRASRVSLTVSDGAKSDDKSKNKA